MSARISILIAEDNPDDVELVLYELRRSGLQFDSTCVSTETEFLQKLRSQHTTFDVVLADFTIPQFGALRALELIKLEAPHIRMALR